MSESQVYWWLMLDNFAMVACAIFIMSCMASILIFISSFSEDIRYLFFLIPIITVMLLCCLVPSSKDYAMIKVIPKIANSDFAAQVPVEMQSMYDMAKSYMKEKLEAK